MREGGDRETDRTQKTTPNHLYIDEFRTTQVWDGGEDPLSSSKAHDTHHTDAPIPPPHTPHMRTRHSELERNDTSLPVPYSYGPMPAKLSTRERSVSFIMFPHDVSPKL